MAIRANGDEFCFSVSFFRGNFATPYKGNNAKTVFRLWQIKKLPVILRKK